MTLVLLLAVAAGAGAVLRWCVVVALAHGRREFPWGTLTVNTTGCFAVGVAVGLADRGLLGADALLVVSIGFGGSFTTLSTWAWETLALTESGAGRAAWGNAFGTAAACLLAGAAGLALAGL